MLQVLRQPKSSRLLDVVEQHSSIVVVLHDNPDPDAISAGWALYELFCRKTSRPVDLVAGGSILRAENQHMVHLLKPPLKLLDSFTVPDACATVLVDCQPDAGNHLLSHQPASVTAVVDHHLMSGKRHRLKYRDVRPRASAVASIACQYLREHEVTPSPGLACALLYGIRTETRGWDAARADHRAL